METVASYGWGQDGPLSDWLYAEGYRFDFFQAVRLLERTRHSPAPVGETAEPAREAVRFKSAVGIAFPASDVSEVRRPRPAPGGGATGEGPAEMTVNFMGLAGALGPLHAPTTELILERGRDKDTVLRDFLDIFNHRLVSIFYRIRKVHRVGQENAEPGRDRFSAPLFAAFGMGTPGLRGRMQVKDRALLFCAGLLAHQQRSLVGLERVLGEYFRVPVRGREFVGRWIGLDEDQWTAIGKGGRNGRLGEGAVLGKRVWDQQGAFELVLGPLSLEQFLEFLPTGWGFRPLCDLVRFYCGDDMDFRVRLQLKRSEVPAARLSAKGGARLGWTSWLKRAGGGAGAAELRGAAGPFCELLGSEVVVSLASLGAFPASLRMSQFGLPPDKLEELLACTTHHLFGAGRCVVRQGTEGSSMFIIKSGSVRITRGESDGTETHLATLGGGDYFGEMSLITGKARNATAVTLSDCELLELRKKDFDEFRRAYPRFDTALRDYTEGRKEAGD